LPGELRPPGIGHGHLHIPLAKGGHAGLGVGYQGVLNLNAIGAQELLQGHRPIHPGKGVGGNANPRGSHQQPPPTHDELVLAIHNVMAGKRYLSPGISGKVIEGYLEGKEDSQSGSSWQKLSQREREVLKLIAEGYKNKEIAEDLCISLKTVEKHRANLMKKLDLHNAAGLTVYAVDKGLVSR